MEHVAREEVSTEKPSDVHFQCQHCSTPLVVDSAAAGLTLECQSCGKPTVVPPAAPSPAPPASGETANARIEELSRHLKENESQRTEVKGYINQLSIQLHRWQLRLQTLDERNKELTGEMASLQLGDPAAPLD